MNVLVDDNGYTRGRDAILPITEALIHPSLLAQYTWTGKTNVKTVRKFGFSTYKGINNLIHSSCKYADESYTKKNYDSDIVYIVMKYAANRWYLFYFLIALANILCNK